MRRRDHEWLLAEERRWGNEQIVRMSEYVGRLELELESTRAAYMELLRRLAGIEPDDVIGVQATGMGPAEMKQSLDQARAEQRPAWAEPEQQWSADGLSSSLDDDPLDIEQLVYLPADPDPYPEPLPETEHRDRTVGIAPGENPFQGLVGLDPNA